MQASESVTHQSAVVSRGVESAHSAVSWAAIIAGAVIAAALMAMLSAGGSGLGFLAISPWRDDGASGKALAVGAIVWLLLSHIISYGVAGYVTGRLRTKWTDVHSDEIYFRDTAHGFIVWALSSVIGLVWIALAAASTVSGVTSAGASLVGSGAGAAAAVAQGGGQDSTSDVSMDYYADALLRPSDSQLNAGARQDVEPEVTRILVRNVADGEVSERDKDYLVRLVADRAGLSEAEARQRVDEITGQAQQAIEDAKQKAREAAEEARKVAAKLSLWGFAALLLGAFVASLAATVGGRARDF